MPVHSDLNGPTTLPVEDWTATVVLFALIVLFIAGFILAIFTRRQDKARVKKVKREQASVTKKSSS